MFNTEDKVLAATTPTSSPPRSPGPEVAATAFKSSNLVLAFLTAIKINSSITKGKPKTFKGNFGYKKNYKKAIVTLAEGNTIDSSLEIK